MPKTNANLSNSEIINYDGLRDKIYEIRGQKVMLDYDLAAIYGYTTSAFNQQVKNNKEKFVGEDFMFRLTKEDLVALSMSRNLITMQTKGTRGGRAKMPYAFTEQGIYMLMTVLRGELATRQSRALVMAFKAVKDYITDNQDILSYRSELNSILKVITNTKDIEQVKSAIAKLNQEVEDINQKLGNVITKSEISPVLLDFNNLPDRHEFLFLDGELAKASVTYQNIYSQASHSICIIDDYINLKTLRHLHVAKQGVDITIFSDNRGKHLHQNDLLDFQREFPDAKIKLLQTGDGVHDRFIVLDRGTKDERIFHCGASSKDAGKKLAAITEMTEDIISHALNKIIEVMLRNPELKLK